MIEFVNVEDASLADRCIRPLCFGAPGDEYYGLPMFEIEPGSTMQKRDLQLGLQGSCTLVLYRQRYFVLFTRHQIAEISNETPTEFRRRMELLFILMDDGRDSTNLPINNLLFSFQGAQSDDEDDLVIAVIEEAMMTDFMRAQFFPVHRRLRGQVDDHALCAGFPSHLQQVLMEKGGLSIIPICKSGSLASRSSHSTGIVRFQDDHQSLDGMSGGAVLVARLGSASDAATTFIAFLDGIIQRGGASYVRYLTIERFLDRIDQFISD